MNRPGDGRALVPARIELDAEGVPHAPAYGDRYHPRLGAAAQARAVFLAGNGLPARWAGRADFTVLETGFGLGNNFLATWQAWRDDPARPARLHYVSIEAHPPAADDLARCHAATPWPALAAALAAAWPPLVGGLHRLDFDGGRVRLLLAFGEAERVARELDLAADALYLDGFAPERNPAMWSAPLMQVLARRLAPGATAATWTVARPVREALAAAGFAVERVAGVGEKRQTLRARLAPAFALRAPPPRGLPPGTPCQAVVVGAGIAGAWAAAALAEQGWAVAVLDRHAAPATEASGNPGGLFHPTVLADEGVHARLHRAAALRAWQRLVPWIEDGTVAGQADGLLRVAGPGEGLPTMQAVLARHAVPPALAQAVTAPDARRRAGLPADPATERPAWWFPRAGWVDPAALVHRLLRTPGVRFAGGAAVAGLRRDGPMWQALAADGTPLAAAPVLVLANAAEAMRLWPAAGWPLGRSRGQIGVWPAAGAPHLRRPLAGDGYALTLPDGRLLAGATAAPGDETPGRRAEDDAFNRQRLARLTGWNAPPPAEARVGWRAQVPDRLPVVGPVPLAAGNGPASARPTQARWQPREPGLFVLTALGSRGLTWGPLMGEVLAAWVCGTPMPVEARLRDALDPARWRVRAARRGSAGATGSR